MSLTGGSIGLQGSGFTVGDLLSASYLAGAAAVAGGEVRIQNLFRDSKQGDMLLLDILKDMGADVRRRSTMLWFHHR